MGDTGKYKKPEDLDDLHRLKEKEASGAGRIEYDELGNAIWVPYNNLGGAEALARLLNDNSLAISQDESRGTVRRIQENNAGLKKGYDPYDSGMLVKKQWKKKKDLRALSAWIQKKKKLDGQE